MRRILLVPLLLLALACGGDGGTQVASGGIGGTGISSGSVTGFGSFFVTGTEWRVGAGGTVEIDGRIATEDDLELGMFLRVEGRRSPGGATGVASRVRFDEAVRGPVADAPMPLGRHRLRLTVLGRVVEADEGQTVFAGTTFADLAQDDVLEVSGPVARNGRIRATRIEKVGELELGTTRVELKGAVESLDEDGFLLGDVFIELEHTPPTLACGGALALLERGLAPLEDGDLVEVEGVLREPSLVDACIIRSFTPLAQELGEESDDVELQGVIEHANPDVIDLSNFTVNGIAVDASRAELEPDEEGLFRDAVLVEVEGDVAGGVLVARKLELEEGEARVRAEVTEAGLANVDDGELVLLAQGTPGREGSSRLVIELGPSTRIEDDDGGSLPLSALMAGDFLEVRGIDLGEGRLRATEIEVEDDAEDGVELVGTIGSVDADPEGGWGFTVLGVFVDLVQGATELPDDYADNVSGFLTDPSVPGRLVVVEEQPDGDAATFGVAQAVEFAAED